MESLSIHAVASYTGVTATGGSSGSRSWGPDSRKSSSSMRPVGSCSLMPSITGGLNGAPAGRFLDVSGWVGFREED